MNTAIALKNQALDHHEERNHDLLLRARRALLTAMLQSPSGEATVDSIRCEITLPPGVNPAVFGSVPGLLASRKIIERSRYEPTTRPESHARPTAVWQIIDHGKAHAWLAEHPEPPMAEQTPDALVQRGFDW